MGDRLLSLSAAKIHIEYTKKKSAPDHFVESGIGRFGPILPIFVSFHHRQETARDRRAIFFAQSWDYYER